MSSSVNGDDKPALVIMDDCGQVTTSINDLLEKKNDIHTCLLPANITDVLQPINISVNKLAKDFLRKKIEKW